MARFHAFPRQVDAKKGKKMPGAPLIAHFATSLAVNRLIAAFWTVSRQVGSYNNCSSTDLQCVRCEASYCTQNVPKGR